MLSVSTFSMRREIQHASQLYKLWAMLHFFRNLILVYYCEHGDESMGTTSPEIVFTN
jgi:hypothetical protein